MTNDSEIETDDSDSSCDNDQQRLLRTASKPKKTLTPSWKKNIRKANNFVYFINRVGALVPVLVSLLPLTLNLLFPAIGLPSGEITYLGNWLSHVSNIGSSALNSLRTLLGLANVGLDTAVLVDNAAEERKNQPNLFIAKEDTLISRLKKLASINDIVWSLVTVFARMASIACSLAVAAKPVLALTSTAIAGPSLGLAAAGIGLILCVGLTIHAIANFALIAKRNRQWLDWVWNDNSHQHDMNHQHQSVREHLNSLLAQEISRFEVSRDSQGMEEADSVFMELDQLKNTLEKDKLAKKASQPAILNCLSAETRNQLSLATQGFLAALDKEMKESDKTYKDAKFSIFFLGGLTVSASLGFIATFLGFGVTLGFIPGLQFMPFLIGGIGLAATVMLAGVAIVKYMRDETMQAQQKTEALHDDNQEADLNSQEVGLHSQEADLNSQELDLHYQEGDSSHFIEADPGVGELSITIPATPENLLHETGNTANPGTSVSESGPSSTLTTPLAPYFNALNTLSMFNKLSPTQEINLLSSAANVDDSRSNSQANSRR